MVGSQRLFVISESRAGSNWLVETLNCHSQITMLKEIFQEKKIKSYLERNNTFNFHQNDQYFESYFVDCKTKYYGCKILFSQVGRFMDFIPLLNVVKVLFLLY